MRIAKLAKLTMTAGLSLGLPLGWSSLVSTAEAANDAAAAAPAPPAAATPAAPATPPPPPAATAKPVKARVPKKVIKLWNGKDLTGWTADVPPKDTDPTLPDSFIVRNGVLVSKGTPKGHLISNEAFKDYRLEVEYRFPGAGGNCGVLVHASTPRALYKMFPQSIEVQMKAGDAGDFWVIREDIEAPDMEKRRPKKEGQKWGGTEADARRIINLTDDSEKPLGEWNNMVVEARADTIKVWVNGTLVNEGSKATASSGKLALQAEGTEVEFRKVEIGPLPRAKK